MKPRPIALLMKKQEDFRICGDGKAGTTMKVAETFISINGEGPRAGELAVFVRFQGCNLACSYCDTGWANLPDCPCEEMSPGEVADYVKGSGVRNVTLTGGEPLLQQDMPELLERLAGIPSLQVEVETNGAVDIGPFCGEHRPAFTLDYKLPGSRMEDHMILSNYRLLKPQDTVKFVSADIEDLEKARQVITEYDLTSRCHVYISPVFGQIEPEQIVEYMTEHRMNGVRIQIQMHKVIWDPDRRGV